MPVNTEEWGSALKLLRMVSSIQEENARISMVSGRDFSPFTEGMIHLDENMASYILAFLLNPSASHGQGIFFLKIFLNLLNIPDAMVLRRADVRSVEREKVTFGLERKRRLDIFIDCGGFCLGVENKLGASDQPLQARDYLEWLRLASRGRPFYLLYLTPLGSMPEPWSLPPEALESFKGCFITLAWPDLISAFQESASFLPARIRYFANDFCEALKRLKLGERSMKEDEIARGLASLTETAQLKAAHAVYKSYERAAELILFGWARRLKDMLTPLPHCSISVSEEYDHINKELDYLTISYDDLYVSARIMRLGYDFYGVPAWDLLWGEVVHTWDDGMAEPQNQEWLNFLTRGFEKRDLRGNMLNINRIGNPLDPLLLDRARKSSPLYLYNEIMASCSQIERLAEEFRRGQGRI